MTKLFGLLLISPFVALLFAYFIYSYKQLGRKVFVNMMLALLGLCAVMLSFSQGLYLLLK